MDNLMAVADYWRKVKSGELPAPSQNDIDITIWTAEAAIKRIAELEARLATPMRFPNEDAALAMFDIFYQTERNNYGNVQLGFSDAKALSEWIAKALELRATGVKCEVGQ